MRSERTDNIFCEVWLVRVPDEAYGNYLWGVHEDPSDPNPLATVALQKKDKGKDYSFTRRQLHHVSSALQTLSISKNLSKYLRITTLPKKLYATEKNGEN